MIAVEASLTCVPLTISDVRTTVVGTPWRELVFVELVTDEGLTGLGEVRMVNRTDTLARVRARAGAAPRHRHRSVRRRAAGLEDSALRLQPAGRGHAVGAGGVRHRLLGPDGAGARRAGLEAARRPVPRSRAAPTPTAGIRPSAIPPPSAGSRATVVERGYRALKLDPFGAASAELVAGRGTPRASRSSPRCATRSAPTSRS